MQTAPPRRRPQISPRLGQISGVNSAGGPVSPALSTSTRSASSATPTRQSVDQPRGQPRRSCRPTRGWSSSPAAVSFHPVEAAGQEHERAQPAARADHRQHDLLHRLPRLRHQPQGRRRGRQRPARLDYTPLLIARYETTRQHHRKRVRLRPVLPLPRPQQHPSTEHVLPRAPQAHRRASRRPARSATTPTASPPPRARRCTTAQLINFDVSIVQPDPVTHRLEFDATGVNRGSCYLRCHGKSHSPKSY